MKKNYNIFVEGVADERFFKQYISHVSGEEVEDERFVILKGWDNLKTEASFLLPNNHDTGALEDFLENIINPNNRPIFDCWEKS